MNSSSSINTSMLASGIQRLKKRMAEEKRIAEETKKLPDKLREKENAVMANAPEGAYYQDMTQMYDPQGRPIQPGWVGLTGDEGLLLDQFQLQNQLAPGGDYSKGFEAMQSEALRQGPSVWRELQGKQLQQQYAGLQDQLARQQAGQGAQAMNQLAMRGGLGGSAAERMQSGMGQQGLLAQQGLARGMQTQRTQLDIADEAKRMDMVNRLQQAELARGQQAEGVQRFNIQAALAENLQKRAAEHGAYGEAMRAWAAERTAAATPSGGGGKK